MCTTFKFKDIFIQNRKRHEETKLATITKSEIENNRHSESKATSRTLKALKQWPKKKKEKKEKSQ